MQTTQNPKKLLIAPLDWGLGHTTRCIPLIHYLLQKNCQISVAGTDQQFALLKPLFPDLQYLQLSGYNITYPHNYKRFRQKMLYQLPGLLQTISAEHRWLQKQQCKYQWDAVISDNRFGFFNTGIHSVFITHQLGILTGAGRLADNLLRKLNYRYIKKFNDCWVPDFEHAPTISGKLAHPAVLPGNQTYIGPISRFEKRDVPKSCDLLILISGPEPQRSIFENLIFQQVNEFKGKVVILRGLPLQHATPPMPENISVLNNADTDTFQDLLNGADMVICKSGYTTVMDLIRLGKKALLIPTPGQTEQEYLAGWLSGKSMFYSVSQQTLQLNKDLKQAREFGNKGVMATDFEEYKTAVDNLLTKLSATR